MPSVKLTLISTVLVAVAFISGCANTNLGSGPDNSAMMSDIATERDVQRAFLNENSLNSSSILVTCFDGVVTLTGSVETSADRAIADRVAKSVAGVSRVVNNLTVNS